VDERRQRLGKRIVLRRAKAQVQVPPPAFGQFIAAGHRADLAVQLDYRAGNCKYAIARWSVTARPLIGL
jgi:hypothetical protein